MIAADKLRCVLCETVVLTLAHVYTWSHSCHLWSDQSCHVAVKHELVTVRTCVDALPLSDSMVFAHHLSVSLFLLMLCYMSLGGLPFVAAQIVLAQHGTVLGSVL